MAVQATGVVEGGTAARGTMVTGFMAAQVIGALPWLADRPTTDAAQSVADSAVATHVEALRGVVFTAGVVSTAADTGRSHP